MAAPDYSGLHQTTAGYSSSGHCAHVGPRGPKGLSGDLGGEAPQDSVGLGGEAPQESGGSAGTKPIQGVAFKGRLQ